MQILYSSYFKLQIHNVLNIKEYTWKKRESFIQVTWLHTEFRLYIISTYINVAEFNNKIYILFNLSTSLQNNGFCLMLNDCCTKLLLISHLQQKLQVISFTKFIITTLHNKPNINHETYERALPLACKKILILGH